MAAEAGAEIYTAGISETDTSALGVDTVGFGGEEPYIVEDLDAYETMEILTMDQEWEQTRFILVIQRRR